MDQTKVGAFLKDLRKEKEITQEQQREGNHAGAAG